MLGYLKKKEELADDLDALDALDEARKDVHAAAMALLAVAAPGNNIEHEQVEILADVLLLSADELEAVAAYFGKAEQ